MNTSFLNYTSKPDVIRDLEMIKKKLEAFYIKNSKTMDKYNLFHGCGLHHKARDIRNMVDDLLEEVIDKA